MNRWRRFILTAAMLIVGATTAAWACPYIQGVLDWSSEDIGGSEDQNVHDLVDGNWLVEKDDDDLEDFRLYDRDLLARANGINDVNQLKNLTGGVPYWQRNANDEVNYFEIWVWMDVNADGAADAADTIDGADQEWKCLVHEDALPPTYAPGPSDYRTPIFSLLRTTDLELRTGQTYILVLLVEAGVTGFSRTNFNYWKGDVEYDANDKTLRFVTLPDDTPGDEDPGTVDTNTFHPSSGITADPNRLFDADLKRGGKYVYGLDDYEVLRIRVNTPPAPPTY